MMAASKMTDREYCSGRLSAGISKSYYHHVDSRFPKCYLTLPELYKRTADMNTDRGITWHYPRAKMTYTQLYEKALKVAKGLLHAGINRGDVVMSVGVDGPNSFILFMAATNIGAIFAAPYFHPPLDKSLKDAIQVLMPKLMLVGHAPISWSTKDSYEEILHAVEVLNADNPKPILISDDFIKSDGARENQQQTFTEMVGAGSSVSDDELLVAMAAVTENEPTIYTCSSGTTGKPKWVLVGSALFANAGTNKLARGTLADSCSSVVANICTEDFAMMEQGVASFYNGSEVVVLPSHVTWNGDYLAKELLDVLAIYKPRSCFTDQSVITHLVSHPELLEGYDVSSVALEISGSRTSTGFIKALLSSWPNAVHSYGLSESYDTAFATSEDLKKKVDTCGRVDANFEAKIVDETGHCVPRPEVGELWLRSASTFLEYKDQPELTQSVKTSDGWLKTGDLCKMDEDGCLFIMGRIAGAERFKVASEVVYAKVIEDVMSALVGIKQIVVVGKETGTLDGAELCYCIELLEGKSLTIDQVSKFAADNLYQVTEWPMRVFFYEKFPLHGARSKVSKKKLLEDVLEKVAADPAAGWVDGE